MLISGFNEDSIGSLINETLETTQMGPMPEHFALSQFF